jgi:hypothetical protein
MFTVTLSPTLLPIIAFSKPGIICPVPTVKDKGSLPSDESKTSPSVSLPV